MKVQNMTQDNNPNDGGGLAVAEAPPKLKKPPMYCVLLINDDYTPMELSLIHI